MNFHRKTGNKRRRPHRADKQGPRREHVEELHPTEDAPEVESFEDWDLDPEIQRAIRNMDISVPTPIQALAIGHVLAGRDVIAKAETGTGKTLAFGAPMMSNIDAARSTVLGLVLCPTRELAQQVADVLAALALPRGVRVALVVGGDPMHPQIASLQAGAQVVVGTPGRVLDLYQQRFLSFPWTEVVVLDEADKMFEIGFLDDIKKILSYLPDERQTLLFSATFPTEVLKLARNSTRDPAEIATRRGPATVTAIRQVHMQMEEGDRALALTRLLEQSDEQDVFLVFCERRTDVDRLFRRMERLPFGIKALHGGYDQPSRFRVMSAFRTGEVKALLATDVASRGLDVEHVTHVINYSVPRELEDYTHRIGRTGRAGRTGTAITFVVPSDGRRWRQLVSRATWEIPEEEPPQRYARARRPARERDADERGTRDGEERPEERPQRGEERGRRGRARGRERDEERGRDRDAGDGRARGRRGRRREEEPRPEREERPRRGERPERASDGRRPSRDGEREEGHGRRRGGGSRGERGETQRRTAERPRSGEESRDDAREAPAFGSLPTGRSEEPRREGPKPEKRSGDRPRGRSRAPEGAGKGDAKPPAKPGSSSFGAGL